ncbi:LexA family transcriptional regulator [Halomonas sp. LS-001]
MHKNQEQMHLPYAQRSAIIAFMQKDTVRKVLQRLINESGKRPTEVARYAGVSQSTLSRILNGKIESPSDRQVSLLAEYFGVTGDQLRGYEPISSTTGSTKTATHDIELHTTEIVEGNEPPRSDEVDLPCFREVEFSAGDGRTQIVENGGHTVRFPLAKLAARGVSPANAACATASGSSMTPTIADGSPIAIDKGTRHIVDGKIYALDHGGMLRIKRLYKLPLGRIRLVSDNSDEYPEEVHSLMGPDAPKIIGRVFWWEVFD